MRSACHPSQQRLHLPDLALHVAHDLAPLPCVCGYRAFARPESGLMSRSEGMETEKKTHTAAALFASSTPDLLLATFGEMEGNAQ